MPDNNDEYDKKIKNLVKDMERINVVLKPVESCRVSSTGNRAKGGSKGSLQEKQFFYEGRRNQRSSISAGVKHLSCAKHSKH